MKKKCSAFQKRWSCVVVSVVITTIGATRLSKIKQVSRFLLSTVSAKTLNEMKFFNFLKIFHESPVGKTYCSKFNRSYICSVKTKLE